MLFVKQKLTGVTLLTAAILAACGGGSGKKATPTSYDLSGTVTGLNGAVTLNWSGESLVLSGNGNFSDTGRVTAGENITLSLSNSPSAQTCSITTQKVFNNVSADIAGIGISCNDSAGLRVSVNVRDYFTGNVIEGAEVDLAWDDDGVAMQRTATTDASGAVEVFVPSFEGRMSVSADAEGSGEQSVVINSDADDEAISANVLLLPVNETLTFAAADGGSLEVGGVAVVDIPGAAFELADGTAYTGNVEAEITLIDPSSDPGIMPGDYTTVDEATGVIAQIESYGAVNITFASSDGDDLDLVSGESATIRIPVANGVTSPPATIPLFYFDESLGRWVEEGEATLTTSNGVSVYEGSVNHFTTWNADYLYESIYIEGCVEDTAGNSVTNTVIQTRGSDYIGTASTQTDSNGDFVVAAKPSSRVFLSARSGTQSRTITVDTGTTDEIIENCLVVDEAASTVTLSWGENPRDLDTHFFGPADETASSLFHIAYTNKSEDVGETTIYLDVDDITSYGPEILTIPAFPYAGTYRYSVHHFSGSSNIQESPARVELNLNGEISIYSPPEGTPTGCWTAFDLEVDTAGDITVVPQNLWEESISNCTSSPDDLTSETASRTSVVNSPFNNAVKNKYYAK